MTRKATVYGAAVLLLAAAGPASAQLIGSPQQNTAQPVVGTAPRPSRGPVAPPALPGSRAEKTEVAPAGKNAADMPPTEALFDSINRGDLASAKEAINRGADLEGRNVLGLSPLELAVDLGRNQISFLLLSLRGGNGYATANGPGPAGPPGSRAAKAAADRADRAEQAAAQKAERAERAARERDARAMPAQPAAPQTPRLFAGNGGAPVPQAGFLGFDAGR